MSFYHRSGNIPPKRHTQFRKPDGSLYSEELVSTEGFSSIYSLVYHCHPPTLVKDIAEPYSVAPEIALEKNMQSRSLLTFGVAPEEDYLKSRVPLLVNSDLHVSAAAPQKSMSDYFFKNADADEVLFIHEGKGKLHTMYGEVSFGYGDYVVIPRGTIYQISFETDQNGLFFVKSYSPVHFHKCY